MKIGIAISLIIFLFFGMHSCGLCKKKQLQVGHSTESQNIPNIWIDSFRLESNRFLGITNSIFSNKTKTGNLGQLVADCGLAFSNNYMLDNFGTMTHFSVFNPSGLAASLPTDSIYEKDVAKVIPYKFKLVILELSGTQIDSLLNYLVFIGGAPVAGIEITGQNNTWIEATIANLPFSSRRNYWVAVTDYMAAGEDGFSMLKNAKQTIKTEQYWYKIVSDELANQFEKIGIIKSQNKPRIHNITKP